MKKIKKSVKKPVALHHLRKAKPVRSLQKQQLQDLEKRIAMEVGSFLVLIDEGTPTQVVKAKQRAASELLKIGPDMEKIAQTMGKKYASAVHDFLDSVDNVVHSPTDFIDSAKINRCFYSTEALEKVVKQ